MGLGFGFGLGGSEIFDYFVMKSNENLQDIMNIFSRSGDKYINRTLKEVRATPADFTDTDWHVIEQYIGEDEYNG